MKIVKKEKFFFKELSEHHIFTRCYLENQDVIWKFEKNVVSFDDDSDYYNQKLLELHYLKYLKLIQHETKN